MIQVDQYSSLEHSKQTLANIWNGISVMVIFLVTHEQVADSY